MKEKYAKCGLDYELILSKYPNIDEYEMIVNTYLQDEFFKDLETMINDDDFEMAKDATKGLYVLAGDLYLFPLYETLLEIYEDLEYETYKDLKTHYNEMIEKHQKIKQTFIV